MLHALRVAFLLLAAASVAWAQQPGGRTDADSPAATTQAQTSSQISPAAPRANPPRTTHRFWDRTNDLLFAGVGASRALDYSSTLNLRRRGDNEILLTNSIVDNHPLFGGIEAAGTAASIGVSYLFHRTGHHRLERWTSIIHIGAAAGGAARNYALKTQHAQ
jgi:hypothetical protein